MAQGKLKVKSKLPKGAKVKKTKGSAVTKRSNAPKRSKAPAVDKKMKTNVTKMVNKAAEEQLRSLATTSTKLSDAQKRVAAAPSAPVPAKKPNTRKR